MQLSVPQPGKKYLVICEKPSVAKDLLSAYGGGKKASDGGYFEFVHGWITWCFGHLVEFVQPSAYHEGWKEWNWSVLPMIPEGYNFRYTPAVGMDGGKGTRKQLKVIGDLMKQADVLVNGCDAGREGELIWWEAVKYGGWGKNLPAAIPGDKPAYRLWIQAMTPDDLRKAWNGMLPMEEKLPLARAAYCRSESDWLLGLNLTRAATLSFPRVWGKEKGQGVKVWSIGRVQTPVLALVVRRDLSIENFVSRPFYELKLMYQGNPSGEAGQFEGTLQVPDGYRAFDPAQAGEAPAPEGAKQAKSRAFEKKEEAQALLEILEGRKPGPWKVSDEKKSGVENPPGLFSLSELQRWCNKAWGWSAQQTLDIAQTCYETEKTLSYPRTSSAFLPESSKSQMDEVHASILSGWFEGAAAGKDVSSLCPFKPSEAPRAKFLFNDAKITDHFAIVPTGVIPKDLDTPPGKLWLAVARRFLTAFGDPARVETVRRTLTLQREDGGKGEYVATCSGKLYKSKGWLEIDGILSGLTGGRSSGSADRVLPDCGDTSDYVSGRLHEGSTKPPRPFDDASLIAIMENISAKLEEDEDSGDDTVEIEELKQAVADLGLGTPATRASILEVLLTRGYLARTKSGPSSDGKKSDLPLPSKKGGKYICSTEAGRRLISSLEDIKLEYLTEAMLTAQWEKRLQDMENGDESAGSREDFLGDLCERVKESIGTFQSHAKATGNVRPDPKPTGVMCPKSGEEIKDIGKCWVSPGFPKLGLWKSVAGKDMTLEDYLPLLKDGKTGVLTGFVSKANKEFSAALKFDEKANKVVFDFPEIEGKPTGVMCPKSGKEVEDCGKFYRFPGYPKSRFWKVMAQREMKPSEYAKVLAEGKLPGVPGFTSSKGKDFSADLVFKNGEVKFDFGGSKGAPKKRTKK